MKSPPPSLVQEPLGLERDKPSVVGVMEATSRIQRSLRSAFAVMWVQGEVASASHHSHLYFTLKDESADAVIRCVMFRSDLRRGGAFVKDGERIVVRASPTVFAPRGSLQLRVDAVKRAGRGSLLEALERLKQKLAAEGLFTREKRPLPEEPRVIGVVTSARGAAIGDVCQVAFRRGGAHIVLAPAVVQGADAPASLCRALGLIERHPSVDVVILGRGGGSKEDLMAFNDEEVVRRVASCRVPVVSAVGHEIDLSLTDLAADHRAATPSQAAELVIPDASARREILRGVRARLLRAGASSLQRRRAELSALRRLLGEPRYLVALRRQRLDGLEHRLAVGLSRALKVRQRRLNDLNGSLFPHHPRASVAAARGRVGPLSQRMRTAVSSRVSREGARLQALDASLEALSPLSVLLRGYAIAVRPDGTILRNVDGAAVGDRFTLRLGRGTLRAEVTYVEKEVGLDD